MNTLTTEEILNQLTMVFRQVFDDENILLTMNSTAEEIEEWDSLNQIKIILACEKHFDIKLNARDISALENVGAMVEHLRLLNV